jgi:NAD(P)-dependent dehydrogenase (short-subunit alcohol dehydrogenase family)
MKLFGLKGRTAFIPGGYGGIGAAISRGLAQAGAKVVIAGRDAKKARALAARIGRGARGVGLDVEDVQAIRDTVDDIGRVDILVNCVGIQREQALTEVTEEAYDLVYRTNLKSAMFLAQAVAKKQIAAKRGGRQVHLLSVRAQLGLRGRGYSAYCSTKGGLVMLIRQHASELGRHGICVNGVAPTVVRTEMGAHWLKDPKTAAWLKERIPLGRVAEPADCVGATLFFCSPAGEYVTGQILYLDGGITASQ